MSEIDKAVRDSLQRQIAETKKQIKQISAKNSNKDLELRRRTDQTKAKIILLTLYSQKQAKDLEELTEEHRKQWTLDFHNQESLIMHFTTKIIQWNYFRIKSYEEISDSLKTAIPYILQIRKDIEEEETTERMMAESRVNDENQSTGRLTHLQEIIKLESIRREILNFAAKIQTNSSSSMIRDSCKSFDHCSPVCKNPDFEQNFSMSSEWPMASDNSKSMSGDSFKKEENEEGYSKVSENAISLHSASSSENVEFLAHTKKSKMRQKKNCWEKCLSCFASRNNKSKN